MRASFELNHQKLAADPRFAELARELCLLSPIDSRGAFNCYCETACRLWARYFPNELGKTSAQFTELRGRIEAGGENVISTGWGGVVIRLHEPPRVEKYLVVHKGTYLALEMHEQKDERLEVREGAGLILWRRVSGQPLAVEAIGPDAEFHLEPGKEHCLIGTENLLVFERSLDPRGMDRDLIFIYTPDDKTRAAENSLKNGR